MIAGAVFVALSGLVLVEGVGLQFYSEGVPGPGFFPILIAVTLAISGILLIASRAAKPAGDFSEFERPSRSQAHRSFGAWLVLLGAALLVNFVGFLVAMFLLVAALLLGIERRRGLGTIATIILTPLLAYLFFDVLLQVRLPVGLFGD